MLLKHGSCHQSVSCLVRVLNLPSLNDFPAFGKWSGCFRNVQVQSATNALKKF